MLILLLAVCPAVVGISLWFFARPALHKYFLLAIALLHAIGTAILWTRSSAFGIFITLDSVGLLFLTLTSAVFLMVAIYSLAYLESVREAKPTGFSRYTPCLLCCLSSMTLVATTQHLALMWAAVEATTLATAPLIYFHRRNASLEATWKYLLICSVGIAIALLGTFFLGIASSAVDPESPLTLPALLRNASRMSPLWLRSAFVLAIVGYGTKAGLAPMHTWLPDAHGQAPSPISALLSGALLNCAFLGIVRFYQVCAAAGLAEFARTLFLVLGVFSIGLATAFIVGQRDYKRLFAYSSVENMGIVAFGLGIGGTAAWGSMFHLMSHSLVKAGLFLLAGNFVRAFGSTKATDVRGAAQSLPITSALIAALTLAVGGLPPFAPFVSEFTILRAAVTANVALGLVFLALLCVAFLGTAAVILPMIQGSAPLHTDGSAPTAVRAGESLGSLFSPALLGLLALAFGIWIPPALNRLLADASRLVGG